MMRAEVWQAVDRALDERRDPLDDEAVLEHLVGHPEDLGAIEGLGARLRALGTVTPAGPPPVLERSPSNRPLRSVARVTRTGALRAAAVLLVAALIATGWALLSETRNAAAPADEAAPGRNATPTTLGSDPMPTAVLGRVLDVGMRFTRTGPGGIRRTTWQPGQQHAEHFTGRADARTTPNWSLTWILP